jgi:hypothetical protein
MNRVTGVDGKSEEMIQATTLKITPLGIRMQAGWFVRSETSYTWLPFEK